MEELLGGLVWATANYLYADMRRKGKGGFSRIVLFWMGIPTTWLWLFLVTEGSEPEIPPAPDDAEALLAEIRQERMLKAAPDETGDRPLGSGESGPD